MKDQALIRIAEETTKALKEAHPYSSARRTVPSYNALLQAAKANHPGDPFLSALPLFDLNQEGRGCEEDNTSTAEMIALFAQIRIVLEALMEESGTPVAR